jgi:hypothetical protein
MALLLFGQQSNGRLTEMVRSSALPRVHAICTWLGSAIPRGWSVGIAHPRRSRPRTRCGILLLWCRRHVKLTG